MINDDDLIECMFLRRLVMQINQNKKKRIILSCA